jgi:succinate dehydrogenase hydrophobic anchor subunit
LTVLRFNVWDILVAEQISSEEWHIAIGLDLKGKDYGHGILCTIWLDIVYRLVYKFKLVYSFTVVYRCNKS